MQNVVYNEFLPAILSPDLITKYNLSVDSASKYNESEEGVISAEFNTAAYRFINLTTF